MTLRHTGMNVVLKAANHAVTGGRQGMDAFIREMRIAGYSPVTIKDRVELIRRFEKFIDKPLTDATAEDIARFQDRAAKLAPASANIYARHLKAFYKWTHRQGLTGDLAEDVIVPRVPRGRPHPTSSDDLAVIFACTTGALRLAYVLAAFAGLRRGEICRLQRQHLDLQGPLATILVMGKGGHERTVPLLKPVVDELHDYGLPRAGYVLKRRGEPYKPADLSIDSLRHLQELRVETTLHSMRHAFATSAARATRDPLFVRDLLGHQSVQTTEIYMDATANDGHLRLAGVTAFAESLLPRKPERPTLRTVNE